METDSSRAARYPTARQFEMQFAVSQLLLTFAAPEDVLPRILQVMSTGMDWDIAIFWLVDAHADELRCQCVWHSPQVPADDFIAICQQTTFAPGIGLPGRAWLTEAAIWAPVVDEQDFGSRATAATRLGLRSGLAFPVRGSAGLIGVVEYFSRQPRGVDDGIIQILATLGNQLGQYIERGRAEMALRENEARNAAILETALDAIITIDHQGLVLEFNPAAERMFGMARAAVLGKAIADLIIPPALRAQHREGLQRYLATGEGRVLGRRLELTALRADGIEFPVELAITRVLVGGPPLFTAYLRDISERKQALRELQERADHAALSGAVGRALTSIDPISIKLQRCAEAIVNQLGAAFARVWTLNQSEDMLELQASAGLYTHLDGGHSRVPVGALKIGLIAQEREPHLTNNVHADPRVGDQEWARREGMVAFAGYPLIVERRIVGVVAMFARHELAPSTLDILASVADEIAIAIDQVQAQAQRERLLVTERAARARLQAVLDVLPIGIEITDADGALLDQNAAAHRIWEHSVALGAPMLHQEHLARWPESGQTLAPAEWGLARALEHGEVTIAEELDIVTPSGRQKTVLNSAVPVRDETGMVVGGVAATVDITERKQLERRTREALDALLTMAEVLVSVDFAAETTVSDPEPGQLPGDPAGLADRVVVLTRQLLGCDCVTLAGVEVETGRIQPLAAVGLPSAVENERWATLTARSMEDILDVATAAQLRAGEAAVLALERVIPTGYPTFGAANTLVVPMLLRGELVGILTTSYALAPLHSPTYDIALTTAVGKLATLVVERERLLRQREEARANELALREVNRRIGQFLSIASHELKTPLTTIKLNTQILLRRLGAAPGGNESVEGLRHQVDVARERLHATNDGINRVLRLVDDLLDLSRIREGKLELQQAPCDLAHIVRQTVAEQRQQHPDRLLQLELPVHRPVPVLGDADRLGQVLTNYLTNALKYSPAAAPVVVRLEVTESQARVAVQDQGPGLPLAELGRVWELYHRAPGVDVQSGSGVGLGLGLHISKTLIEQHHGQVGVESILGQGSTFWFTLPLAAPKA